MSDDERPDATVIHMNIEPDPVHTEMIAVLEKALTLLRAGKGVAVAVSLITDAGVHRGAQWRASFEVGLLLTGSLDYQKASILTTLYETHERPIEKSGGRED